MRSRIIKQLTLISCLSLTACIHPGANPVNPNDPYEKINRPIYKFNYQIDRIFLKPIAQGYTAVLPAPIRKGVSNFYSNINMFPTVVNDLLQGQGTTAILDTWRVFINSTFGIGGLIDVASTFGLAPHSNDMGITFAKWGDHKSPFIMVPFIGPSTIRDGFGLMFDCVFTPYFYINPDSVVFGLLALRYIDLRSQLLDTDKLLTDAIDPYTMLRDAYLQHRQATISKQLNTNINQNVSSDISNNLYLEE